MQLVDIGVNLTNARLYYDRAALKQQALTAGVIHQIITGTCLKSSAKALEIALESKDGYYSSTAGCHPHDAKDFKSDDIPQLLSLAKHKNVVAIGECGLDFNRNYSPPEVQIQVFDQQIQIAIQTQLPLFMHQRDAHQALLDQLKPRVDQITGGVVHCFTGDKRQLRDYLDMGLYVGITGWLCDERRGSDLQEAIKYAPLDRILLETDAPYLLPRTIRPKPKSSKNISAYLPWVVQKLAQITQTPESHIAETTTQNCRDLFTLVDL